jgi:indolepyruvate ferredoxin oxidoreductase beta subunit
MRAAKLSREPFNVIVTGVGGQGSVMVSRVLARMLVMEGFRVTVGETFGASQRGGSVMSHLRISETSTWSPQIPHGHADILMALEPIELIRILPVYINKNVLVLSNTRPIYPVSVIAGENFYPSLEEIKKCVGKLVSRTWFIDATDEAVKMGNAILGNIALLGALSATGVLPLRRDFFRDVIAEMIPEENISLNLAVYDRGAELIKTKV